MKTNTRSLCTEINFYLIQKDLATIKCSPYTKTTIDIITNKQHEKPITTTNEIIQGKSQDVSTNFRI